MGLENILIIVKAVMSTPEELDVKYRIAVGLSKEGWAITRNLVTLVIMTTLGIIFFNYVLKEFCILALVGLLCDTFMQLVFFPTVLSIDLRRLEVCMYVCMYVCAGVHVCWGVYTHVCAGVHV